MTAFEAGLARAERRAAGAFFTPADLADRLARIALDGQPDTALVCDPACGAGAMLLAAGRLLASRGRAPAAVAANQIWGIDRDPATVAAARAAIVDWAGADPGDHLVVGDGLRAGERWPRRFDVVLGNPPFLNQLSRATVRTESVPPELAAVVRPYTDTAWLFLAVAPSLVRPGGRAVLIQPQSVVAARDAGPVRAHVLGSAALEGLWSTVEPVFDASVRVCAPVLRVGATPIHVVRRWEGPSVQEVAPLPAPSETSTWSRLLAIPDPPPPVAVDGRGRGRIGDLATATAGFRDEFYGLAPFVSDVCDGTHPRLITTAHVEPGRLLWGERAVRFAGRRLLHPRVDASALARTGPPRLARWVTARLQPKVVVATQTRVVEAAVDGSGDVVPSTPVISVEGGEPWMVAAALTAPPVSAWAVSTHGGTALSAGAIKLAARHVLDVPLPVDEHLWRRGAELLAVGELLAAAEVLNAAHEANDDVLEWWARRARIEM